MSGNFCSFDFFVETVFKLPKIEEFVVPTNFVLKSFFEFLFGFFELFVFFEKVKMRECAQNKRKTMRFQEGQELKCFHLKSQTCINDKDNNVSDFGKVNHGANVIGAFNDGNSLFFVGPQGDRSVYLVNFVLGEVLDKGTNEGGLAALM